MLNAFPERIPEALFRAQEDHRSLFRAEKDHRTMGFRVHGLGFCKQYDSRQHPC